MTDNIQVKLDRTINAPLEKVWAAWTDAKQVQQWWGPIGFSNPTCRWEAKVGGVIDLVMLGGPEMGDFAGMEAPMTGEFTEVVPNEKLVYTSSAIMNGKVVLSTLTTVTFSEENGQTKLALVEEVTMTTPEAAGPLSGMEIGLNQTVDKLVAFVEGA